MDREREGITGLVSGMVSVSSKKRGNNCKVAIEKSEFSSTKESERRPEVGEDVGLCWYVRNDGEMRGTRWSISRRRVGKVGEESRGAARCRQGVDSIPFHAMLFVQELLNCGAREHDQLNSNEKNSNSTLRTVSTARGGSEGVWKIQRERGAREELTGDQMLRIARRVFFKNVELSSGLGEESIPLNP